MKTWAATLPVVLMLFIGTTVNEDFQLSASLPKSEVNHGEPISLEIILKNISQRRVHVVRSNNLNDYKIEVRDSQGKRVMPTEEGKKLLLRAMFISGRTSIYLDPGQELRDKIDVSRIFDLGRPGTYSIMVKRSVPKRDNDGWSEVVSNTVKIVVK